MKLGAVIGGVLSLIVAFYIVLWLGRTVQEASQDDAAAKPLDPAVDIYPTSPFEKPPTGPYAKAEISEATYDFGITKVASSDPDAPASGSHAFVIKNTGAAPLKLAKGPHGCKCTLSELARLEVPPGESTEIVLEWKPLEEDHAFHKTAVIWTNDPTLWEKPNEGGKLTLTIKGQALQSVQADPRTFSLGTLKENESTPIEAEIFSKVREDLEVSVKSTSSEFVHAEIVPMTADELKEKEYKSGFKLKGHVEPKVGIGKVFDSIIVETNDDVVKQLDFSVEAIRVGPLSIAGKHYLPAISLVDFGQFDAAKGTETTLNLYTARLDPPMTISVAGKEPEHLVVEVNEDQEFPEEDRQRFLIKIKVPGGLLPERRGPGQAGTIQFQTSHPDVPEFKIHVRYESR